MKLNILFEKMSKQAVNYIYNIKQRVHNKNKTFSIISSNCIGTSIYKSLNIKYNTPTIGLFFYAPCYIKFIYNLEYYLSKTLTFDATSKYLNTQNISYPIGKLDDIEIHFMHYQTQEDAQKKWERRVDRINFNNLFFIFSDRDKCSYKELRLFNDYSSTKKVCFTSQNYPELESTIWVKEYANAPHIGDLYSNKLYRKYLNISEWFNT